MDYIVFISQNLTERNYDRYGIDLFKKKKINYKFLDLSYLFDKRIDLVTSKYEKKKNDTNLIKFKSYLELLFFLLKQKKFCYSNACSYKSLYLSIIEKIIVFRGNIKIYFSTAIVPVIDRKIYHQIINFLKKDRISLLIKTFKFLLNKCILFLEPHPKVAFISGLAELHKFNKNKTKIVYSNCLDYNQTLSIKKHSIKKNFIVFLDENVPNHPDAHVLDVKHAYSRKEYWSRMKKIFETCYKRYNKKIIISLHPRSTLNDIEFVKSYFKGPKYRVVYNQSLKSVVKSYLVLAHFSTSIQFAIILNKPIMLIQLKNFDEHQRKSIKFYHDQLKVQIINDEYKIKYKPFNKSKYKKFIKNFISANMKEKKEISWLRIINYHKINNS